MAKSDNALPEVAFYYPGHLWRNSDWIKTLLLFFDGLALLLPEYKKGEPEASSPELVGPLREKGLLHYLVADEVVDKHAATTLVDALRGPIESGAFDSLAASGTAFHAISMSRMGYYGAPDLAEDLFKMLAKRGLARDSVDGVSVPLHPLIRYLILTLLSQILRSKGLSMRLDLSPTTDNAEVVRALVEVLNLPTAASAGHVVAFDLNTVAVDLSSVPLDEVLSFKAEHAEEYRAYAREVRRCAREIALLAPRERSVAFDDRQSQLDDLASDLKRRSRSAWRLPASFGLGLAGAYWTLSTGDWMAAMLGAGAVLTAGMGGESRDAGAFSYLFSSQARFPLM